MSKSLIRELGEWKRLEGMFRENFSETALGDRDFRKMKLREYDRIWRTYNGKEQTTDERALIVMLRFQRRKIRRALYPGLLRRLLNQMTSSVLLPGVRKQAILLQNSEHIQDYGRPTLPTVSEAAIKEKEVPGQSVRVQSATGYHQQLRKTRSRGKKRKGLRV